ncbi:MAG TPA: MauE/DoxX family redox-associated membrane protein, partial [Ktedonobacteraceae bacterium]|nr:MauE/DoxX family redox-associated membrane protein [Ktedonobacteraceae bacterium]
ALALLLARLLLSAVFLLAGFAKLADLPGSQKVLHHFGVPEALARPLGIMLPLAELAVAAMLLSTQWAWYGALGALVLLLMFSAGISYNLARGRRPDCHCFGQLHSAPVGPSTLARNALLALVAVFVVKFGRGSAGPSVISWFTAWPVAQQITLLAAVIAVVLMAGEGWVLLHMLSQQGRLLLRAGRLERRLAQAGIVFGIPEQAQTATGLSVGTTATAFVGRGLDDETISLNALRALGKPVVLLFTNPTCGPCSELMPNVGRWQCNYADRLTVALLSRGSIEDNRAKVSEHHLSHLVLQRENEIDALYGVQGTPSAVLIHPDGLIESPLVVGPDAIRTLVEKAVSLRQLPLLPLILPGNNHHGAASEPAPPRIGVPAPAFSLPDLNGEIVSLRSFAGTSALLLFWNPDCGFCRRMLPDLQAWEANLPQGAPRLLVISRGTVQENRALGLRSPVLLNEDDSVSRLFGVTGTPEAIGIDAQGNIASTLIEGATDILALANSLKDALHSSRV